MKPIQPKAQMLMAWIHRVNNERKGSKDVESTFLEVTFL